MSDLTEGEAVEVRGMSGAVKYVGTVSSVEGSRVAVVPEGRSKPRSEPAARVRRIERVAARPSKLTRKPDTTRPESKAPLRRHRPARDEGYLKHIRTLACCACGITAERATIEAHHWTETRGVSQKVSDYFTTPLCTDCHREFHDRGRIPPRNPDQTRDLFRHQQLLLLERTVFRERRRQGRAR